jgi:hypothetical protein
MKMVNHVNVLSIVVGRVLADNVVAQIIIDSVEAITAVTVKMPLN